MNSQRLVCSISKRLWVFSLLGVFIVLSLGGCAIFAPPMVEPSITGLSPLTLIAHPARQWIEILGRGFFHDFQVTLSMEGDEWIVPPDRTEYVNSQKLKILVGLTDAGWWSVEVRKSDGAESNLFDFYVML